MFLSLSLARKYSTSKFRKGFISFSAWVTIIGITLGVASLILTSTIMNGLQFEIKSKLYDIYDQIVIYPSKDETRDYLLTTKKIARVKGVKYVAPFSETYGLLQIRHSAIPILIHGIQPDFEKDINSFVKQADLKHNLNITSFDFIMTQKMVNSYDLRLGDQVRLILPKFRSGIVQGEPIQKNIHLSGFVDSQFGVNNQQIYMNIEDVMILLRSKQPTGFKIKTDSFDDVDDIVVELTRQFPNYSVVDWTSKYQLWMENLSMQKRVFSIFLFLLIMVSMFSLIANLSMLVVEKKSEIAVLKTLGASDGLIFMIFIWMGLILTAIGITLGAGLAFLIICNLDVLTQFIEHLFNIKFFSPKLWPISFVPSKIIWNEIYFILSVTFLFGSLVALIPARRAILTDPATLLSYES